LLFAQSITVGKENGVGFHMPLVEKRVSFLSTKISTNMIAVAKNRTNGVIEREIAWSLRSLDW
jgi:hypothetical protein